MRKFTHSKVLGVLVTILLLTSAQPIFADTELTWQELNQQVVEEHIVHGYKNLFDGTVLYRTFIEELCIKQGEMELLVAQEAFKQLNQIWQSVQHIRVGPIEIGTRFYQIQMWPDKRGSVGKQLNKVLTEKDVSILLPERFANLSVAVQGLPMMERLLFSEEKLDDFKCGMVLVAAINLQNQVNTILSEWQGSESEPGFSARLSQSKLEQEDALFQKHSDVSATFLNMLVTALQGLKENKLQRALTEDLKNAKPKRLEFWRSGQTTASILANLKAYEEFYDIAFSPLVQAYNLSLHKEIKAKFKDATYQANSMPSSLYEQLSSEDKSSVVKLNEAIGKLHATLVQGLPKTLNLRLGFNALDGD